MEVTIKGTNKQIRLTQSDFITQGGQGQIYAKRNTIFKIFLDPKKMIPFSKIDELSQIQDSNVIKPEKIVLNSRGKPIGYTMKRVPDSYVLCQLFPKPFRTREKLGNDVVLKLVLRVREMIKNIHLANILLVDINEMNFLVTKNFTEIFGIDVDSFQTQSFPALALMESVRDRHTKKFSQLTDWFSFGIVSFQMFVGIHPYRGNHPTIKYPNDKSKELNERMEKNIPVFHKDVKYPRNVLPFDVIPQAYRDWYKAIFYEGKRIPAPTDAVEVVIVPVIIKEVASSKDFDISELLKCPSEIIRVVAYDNKRVVTTKNQEIYIGNQIVANTTYRHIAVTPLNAYTVCGDIENGFVKLYNINNKAVIPCSIAGEEMMSYDGRMFVKNEDSLFEVEFVEMGRNVRAVPHLVANVLENATQIFEGAVIQNMLGRSVVSVFPSSKTHYQIPIPELDKYQIIDAKYDNKVLIVIAVQNGKYNKFIFKFDDKFKTYSLREEKDISYCGINFIVLDNGTVAHINESEELELFHNRKDSTTVKKIDSPTISGDMKLFKDGMKVLFVKGAKLYWLRMK